MGCSAFLMGFGGDGWAAVGGLLVPASTTRSQDASAPPLFSVRRTPSP